MRYLIKVKIFFDGNNAWTLNGQAGTKVFHGDINAFAKFLQKLKAKDNFQDPKSFRSMTYKNIAQEVINGTDNTIFIWSNICCCYKYFISCCYIKIFYKY